MRRYILVLFLVVYCFSTVHGKNRAPDVSGSAPKKIQNKGKRKCIEYTDYNPATAPTLGQPKPGEALKPPFVGATYTEPSTTERPGKMAKGKTKVLALDGEKASLTKKPKAPKTEKFMEAKRVISRRYWENVNADPDRRAAAQQTKKEWAEKRRARLIAEHKEHKERQAMEGELPEGEESK